MCIRDRYTFIGVDPPSVTSTSTLNQIGGLSTSVSYTTASPSVELTVVASATIVNEDYEIEIVEPNGNATSFLYRAPTGTESRTHIAEQLSLVIDASPILTASSTAEIINIQANNPNYVFWVRVNPVDGSGNAIIGEVETYRERRMLVTNATPVEGVFTISGTPSNSLTEQASYTLTIETTGVRCNAAVERVTLIINPQQAITLTSTNTSHEICEGIELENTSFILSGAATSYSLEWGTGAPNGIGFNPTVADFPGAGTQTITLSGTPVTDATTTTVYYYLSLIHI